MARASVLSARSFESICCAVPLPIERSFSATLHLRVIQSRHDLLMTGYAGGLRKRKRGYAETLRNHCCIDADISVLRANNVCW